MQINRIIDKTYAEGPGCRFCIWVQGCSHRCDGCFATDLWSYAEGQTVSKEYVGERLLSVKDFVSGVTLLGGEPFDQAEELADFAKLAKSLGKNVITFTGYTYAQLKADDRDDWRSLLKYTDLLIDGRFEKSLLDYSRPLVGSSNQQIIFLSDAISEKEFYEYKNRFEVRSDSEGNITFNGMGDIKKLYKLINNIKGAENG